eukprot:Clim_evm5s6 gene=Clim_evmTU5s6
MNKFVPLAAALLLGSVLTNGAPSETETTNPIITGAKLVYENGINAVFDNDVDPKNKYDYLTAQATVEVPSSGSYEICVVQTLWGFQIDGLVEDSFGALTTSPYQSDPYCKAIDAGTQTVTYHVPIFSSLQGLSGPSPVDYSQEYYIVNSEQPEDKVYLKSDWKIPPATVTIDGYDQIECTPCNGGSGCGNGNMCSQHIQLTVTDENQWILGTIRHDSSCGGCAPWATVHYAGNSGYTDEDRTLYGEVYESKSGSYQNECKNIVGSTITSFTNQLVVVSEEGFSTIGIECPRSS